MQSYRLPTLDPNRSQMIWLSMLERIKSQNLNSSPWLRSACKCAALSLLLALGLWVAWHQASMLVVTLAALYLSFILAQFAFIGHDAGHGSLHQKPGINRAFGHYCMTIITGLAFEEWYSRHRAHHQYCQYESRDPDMDVSLVVSLTEHAKQQKKPLGLWMTRHQDIHVWLLSLLFAHSQRHLSQWGALKQPKLFWRDLVALGLHGTLWFIIPYSVFHIDPIRLVLVYILPLFFLGPYLAAIFWVNHIGMPLVRNIESFTFLEHQAITSRTILNPKWMDWFFGGLNYQIEHHLYPQIPSFRLKSVQPIVQEEFVRQSLGYNGVTFFQAIAGIARHFRLVAKS